MGQLPSQLRLDGSNPLLSGHGAQDAANYYMQTQARPAEAQLSADLYNGGRADSTFGGAQLGSMMAGDQLHSYQAGLDAFNNQFNQALAARQSFFGNEGALASGANQLNVQRGLQLATNASGLFQNQQNSQNQFNLHAYDSMLNAQNQREGNNLAQLNRMDQNAHFDAQQGLQIASMAKPGSSSFGGYGGGGRY